MPQVNSGWLLVGWLVFTQSWNVHCPRLVPIVHKVWHIRVVGLEADVVVRLVRVVGWVEVKNGLANVALQLQVQRVQRTLIIRKHPVTGSHSNQIGTLDYSYTNERHQKQPQPNLDEHSSCRGAFRVVAIVETSSSLCHSHSVCCR